ncbi:AMP-binding protein [Neiella marina]|uniref:AMP-binding protein n=1 Tax=Neiella holothuriorum TaxID=2870530 RepID=A0ABS7EEQ6_9GAMM|nr:AMP-binding protein [Neiella holothuriorum]MBW8190818.1 AMP-binding protein [Neiella holothuriorum]
MNKSLTKLFYHICQQQSDSVAIETEDRTQLTFQQLNSLSNRIAKLLQSKGASQGDLIFIEHDKSITAFALMISCLKLGITYANIDRSTPAERLSNIVTKYRPSVYVSDIASTEKLATCAGAATANQHIHLTLSQLVDRSAEFDDCNLVDAAIADDTTAYLMFTSGSTGIPKGVLIKQSSLVNFVSWAKDEYAIRSADRFTNLNPIYFDNSVFDFYASIFNGATLLPVDDQLVKQPLKALNLLKELKPTIWFSVPSLLIFYSKMRAWRTDDLAQIRAIIFGGEGFPKTQLKTIWQLFGHRSALFNVYGPTEGTCICSSYQVSAADIEKQQLLPLGKLCRHFTFDIINHASDGNHDDNIGELVLAGPNIAQGYFNDAAKTAAAFTFAGQGQEYDTYRTGDLVRLDQQTRLLHFCGRKDNQIKKMGHRIELDEVEIAIGSIVGVIENAAIAYQDHDANTRIASFVCTNRSEQEIATELRQKIPHYMIPDKFIFKDMLAKNRNGKIDRKMLSMEIANCTT